MAPTDILDALLAASVRVEIDGEGIALDGPDYIISRWAPIIRAHKTALIALLTVEQEAGGAGCHPDGGIAPAGLSERQASLVKVGAGGIAQQHADARMKKVAANLNGDPALTYAMSADHDIDPDVVILSLAIRGKGICELRIPKTRYDAFLLLELIERHTSRETLQ
jgi:hypothetical protein